LEEKMISYNEAYRLTVDHISPLPAETVSTTSALGRVTAGELTARVDSPSADVSLKDGFAVQSQDIAQAAPHNPVTLYIVGSAVAGNPWEGSITPGEAVRILSGAILPAGADAILAEEFAQVTGSQVKVIDDAALGRNILRRGADVHRGQLLTPIGARLQPTLLGLLAAAGYDQIQVVRRPRVAIIATGDEVVALGRPLEPGKLYASNLVTLSAWCQYFGFETTTQVLPDDATRIRQGLVECLEEYDAVLTSGGAWKGDRDLVVHLLDELGWQKFYHRIRIGPGKAVGFGMVGEKPVFCLPGGPPSNHIAFLELALPGLQCLAGWAEPGLPLVTAEMAEGVEGQSDWTQFVHGRLELQDQTLLFFPTWKDTSRLSSMAASNAVVMIPEGSSQLLPGEQTLVQQMG
jgi:molybdopterin molybdotransferase